MSQAGTFYWQAVYNGDAQNQGSTSTCTSETVTVKNAPSISPALSATNVTTGTSVHDSSTLTNATSTAGGTVTYTVYSNDTCATFFASGGTKNVTSGPVVVPDSDNVAMSQAGTFYWQAFYNCDAQNQNATSTCT